MSISRTAEDVPDSLSEAREGQMTGTLISDIIETVDSRLTRLHEEYTTGDFPFDDNTAGEPLDRPETVEDVMERAPFLFPLDHIETAEPLDEMERRTR